jgi:integrase
LRPGELLGLEVAAIDFLRRELHVARQLVKIDRRPVYLGPPMTPSSVRTVALSDVVLDALAEHLRLYPPIPVLLSGHMHAPGPHRTVELVFTKRMSRPSLNFGGGPVVIMLRSRVHSDGWR